jgi:sporulation integral membrane protein YlbJ
MSTNKYLFSVKILIVLIIFVSCILFPKEVFEASLRGLNTWWNIVFPALLPFFVISELLIALGLVQFLGILLEKVMRPLFNLPGCSAFVVAVGYTSGAPIGSILTADLRRKQLISKNEAERLICFTNNASPLFMFGAVAVGMFKQPEIGLVIALSHYLANLIIGICLGFLGPKQKYYYSQNQIVKKAFMTIIKLQNNSNPLGQILGNAIKKSLNNLLQIGGFIIFFSVLIELLNLFRFLDLLAVTLTIIFKPLMLDIQLAKGIASGIIEMTIGSKIISEASAPLGFKIAAVSLVLGWAGLSIQAQALSMISDTDISFYPFIITRIIHGLLAAGISLIIFNPTISVLTNNPYITLADISVKSILIICLCSFWVILAITLIISIIILIINRKITVI